MIPQDFGHNLVKGLRVIGDTSGGNGAYKDSGSRSLSIDPLLHSGLMHFLVEKWDDVRKHNEPGVCTHTRPTAVQSAVKMGDQFLCVTLAHNRFCFCKGSSHVSNSVYMVVDQFNYRFHQKCHDFECRHFRSPEFAIPDWLLESTEETTFWEDLASLPLSTSHNGPSKACHDGALAKVAQQCNEEQPAS